jgi:uncharacterized membrane protein YkvA (DUF1232 family)
MRSLLRNIRLIWRLMNDRQVPEWTKFIPWVAFLYVVLPIDLLPEPLLGIGILDDLILLLIGLKLFVTLCPTAVVQRVRDEMDGSRPPQPEAEVIDASYTVLDDRDKP